MYKNNGYLNLKLTNTMVSISENKKDIFITITINEGENL